MPVVTSPAGSFFQTRREISPARAVSAGETAGEAARVAKHGRHCASLYASLYASFAGKFWAK